MIRAPGVSRAGTLCDALVETIDLYPTLVDLCEPHSTETHWALDGVSLRLLLEGTASAIKQVSLSYWRNVVSLRSRTHRMLVGRDRSRNFLEPELYDIRRTSDPLQNLAAENPEIVQELRQHLPQ